MYSTFLEDFSVNSAYHFSVWISLLNTFVLCGMFLYEAVRKPVNKREKEGSPFIVLLC